MPTLAWYVPTLAWYEGCCVRVSVGQHQAYESIIHVTAIWDAQAGCMSGADMAAQQHLALHSSW
jgi:hypothetical protein